MTDAGPPSNHCGWGPEATQRYARLTTHPFPRVAEENSTSTSGSGDTWELWRPWRAQTAHGHASVSTIPLKRILAQPMILLPSTYPAPLLPAGLGATAVKKRQLGPIGNCWHVTSYSIPGRERAIQCGIRAKRRHGLGTCTGIAWVFGSPHLAPGAWAAEAGSAGFSAITRGLWTYG